MSMKNVIVFYEITVGN